MDIQRSNCKRMVLRTAVFSSFLFLLVNCGQEPQPSNIGTLDLEEIDPSMLYNRHCVDCHGSKGDLGLMGASSLVSSSMSLTDRIEIITHGSKNGKMRPFGQEHYGGLSDAEIEAVAEYIETLRQ